jgi:hypothetical protein
VYATALPQGAYRVDWRVDDWAAGLYRVTITDGARRETRTLAISGR